MTLVLFFMISYTVAKDIAYFSADLVQACSMRGQEANVISDYILKVFDLQPWVVSD
jgi:hypothetical protein